MSDSERPTPTAKSPSFGTRGLHSLRKCVQGLGEVFKRQRSPLDHMDGSGTERIIKQVEQCPSGALSYVRNEKISKAAG